MSRSSERLTGERVEEVIDDLLQKLPEQVSLSDTRNLVCELLFGLGVSPDDLPIFLLLVVDAYMGERRVDMLNQK
jgi:hypothetical protein